MERRSWSELPTGARLFRVAHIAWGVVNLTALGTVWASAVFGPRSRVTTAGAAGLLAVEGVALVIGRGNCPFGPFQRRLGDPVPMFELFLPPRAAKAAVPVLTVVSLAGLAALFGRWLLERREAGRLTP